MEDRKSFCRKCGAPLKENTKFCAKCGEPVRSEHSTPDLKEQSGNNAAQNTKIQNEGAAQPGRKNGGNKGSKKKIIILLISLIAICIIAAGIFVITSGSAEQTSDFGEYTTNPSGLDEFLSKNGYTKGSDGVYESPDKQVRVERDDRGAPKQIIISGGDTTIFGIGIGDTFSINKIGKKLTSRGYGLSDEDDMSVTYSTDFPGGVKGVQLFIKTDTQKIYNIIFYMEKDSDESETEETLQETSLSETFETQEGNTQEGDAAYKTGTMNGSYECHEGNLDATVEIGWSQAEGVESIHLSGSSPDGSSMGEFTGSVVSSKGNNYTVMDADGNTLDFYYNGLDVVEIKNDDNYSLYGMNFPGFNGIYCKTETSSAASLNVQGDVGDTYEDEYILPHSDTELISDMGPLVQNLSKETIRLAKNEIYARHGRRFKDPELQAYFDSKSWYFGSISPEDFDDSVLNETERKNIEILNHMLGN